LENVRVLRSLCNFLSYLDTGGSGADHAHLRAFEADWMIKASEGMVCSTAVLFDPWKIWQLWRRQGSKAVD
jgi:hypothetical protein